MTCPAPERLLAFASGELSDDQSASVEEHIDSCNDCRAALSSAARGDVAPKFGRYRIDTVLGSGGMGIVYRAWDPQLARAVAIKVVKRASDDATGRARLVREAQSLARLSHPNVCHVYDVGTDGDEVWVAMELIDGVSLREWVVDRPKHDAGVLDVLLGAAEGIAAAHAAGMIHRDVKPENVLVTRDGRAIVTDFGLARGGDYVDPNASTLVSDPNLTSTGAIAGTPAYLAPEQLTGDPIDDRVDQFAWAVMAWEMIAGSRPFPIVFALRVDAVRAGVTPPPTMNKRIATVLTRALQLLPRDRYGSMRELIEDLRAPAPKRRERTKRTPVFVGLGALVLGGAAVTLWQTKPKEAIHVAQTQPAPPTIPATIPATIAPPPAPTPTAIPTPPPPAPTATRPVVTTKPKPKPTVVAVARPAQPTPPTPPTQTQAIVAVQDTGTAVAPRALRPLRRDAAIASMLAFCRIPSDPSHLEPGMHSLGIVDWGKVTSVAVEHGSFDGDAMADTIIAIAGHRDHYRIEREIGAGGILGSMDVNVGDVVALCADREPSNLYNWTGGATVPVTSALDIHGDVQIAEPAKYKALYVRDIDLAAQGSSNHVTLASDRKYFVRTKSQGKVDGLVQMDRWFLAVPPGLAGTDQIESGKWVWLVLDRPELISAPDGGRPRFVMHAVEVIPEVLP
ncbi:MAG TPA: protein kinase [Kofleriaceae bacterium]|jgi:serine/threonine protein kinase